MGGMRRPSTLIAVSPPDRSVVFPADPAPETRSLVERLGEALSGERVAYLQWKGKWTRSPWRSGGAPVLRRHVVPRIPPGRSPTRERHRRHRELLRPGSGDRSVDPCPYPLS